MIINLNNLGGGGGGSTVAWNQIVTGGTEIANININGVQQQVYAPEGDCNYQIVDNLSAVTNPQEGTRAYVKEQYVSETWSGWTFDCTGSGVPNEAFIARFYKDGSELTKLYKAGNSFHWGWTCDGQWHRNANYAYKSVGNSKIFTIVFPNVNEITMTLEDSGTTTATTSQEFTYSASPFQNYIYKSNNTWLVENNLYDIKYMNQQNLVDFYNYFSGLTDYEKYNITLIDSDYKIALRYLNSNSNNIIFQGSDIFETYDLRKIKERFYHLYIYSDGTKRYSNSQELGTLSTIKVDYVSSAHTITYDSNAAAAYFDRDWGGYGASYIPKDLEYIAMLTSGSTGVGLASTYVNFSKQMSGSTELRIIIMDWQYLDKNIHAEYIISNNNLTLLKWEETPIGSGECNYQIVDALSAVTNPQEGTRAYVKEKYVTETWSGWTFDCNGEEAEQSGMIATFTKGGNELAKLYHSYGDFYWDWNQDGEWHRNTDYAYKTVGYSKIFQIVFPNISDVTLYLHDSKTATATTSYSFTYLSPFNSYIYTPSDTWKVENKLFDINYMNRQLLIDFYNYFSGLTDYDKYNITLINSNEKLSYRYLYKTDDDRFYFQGSDTYFDNSIGGIEKNRSSQIYISQSGDIEMSTWSFGCNGAVRVDYVSSAHTVEDVTCGGSAYAWEKILENPRNADYTAMLYSGDTNIASTSIKFTRVVSGGTTYLGAIMDWVYDGKNIHAEYIIEKFDTTTLLKWEETPITTLKLGNTTLSETQLQALIALIPS